MTRYTVPVTALFAVTFDVTVEARDPDHAVDIALNHTDDLEMMALDQLEADQTDAALETRTCEADPADVREASEDEDGD